MIRCHRFSIIASTLLLSLVATFGGTTGIPAPEGSAPDPDREDRLDVGKAAFRDNCLMCHAEELTTRARLNEKQWTTEIDKMIGWGSPLPTEHKGPLLEYLMSEYSDPKASPVPPPGR